jgi:hypothetical protein
MTTRHDKVNELRARMITGPDLWKPAPKVKILLDVDTVRFIGSEEIWPDEWSHETYEAIWEACREWWKANER